MAVPGELAAFMSYARFDDAHDQGQLSEFRERLAAEVRAQTGQGLEIFQDRTDIAWGQNWRKRIDEALDAATLLLVIMTPEFFRSEMCRKEVDRFAARERMLGRSDLILPVYYISAREVEDSAVQASDEIAVLLTARQFADWRELRFKPLASPAARRALAELASRMGDRFRQQAPAQEWPTGSHGRQVEANIEPTGTDGQVTANTEPPAHAVSVQQSIPFNEPSLHAPSALVTRLTGHTGFARLNGGIADVAFSPDGALLASAGGDMTVRIWDVATRTSVRTITGHTEKVCAVAFSPPDGSLLASASEDGTVRIWDAATGAPVNILRGHHAWGYEASVSSVAFSPDGALLASAGGDGAVRIWDVATGTPVRTISYGLLRIRLLKSVAFSPDGARLASAGINKSVRIWDVATGKRLRTITGHTEKVNAVAFSPDGALLASASEDKTVRIWDAATGTPVHTITGHTAKVNAVAFSPPDGALLASASEDKTVRIWDVATGTPVRTYTGHTAKVSAVAFSPEGTLLASAGRDQVVMLWGRRERQVKPGA